LALRVPGRVREQVDEDPLELRGVGTDKRKVLVDRELEAAGVNVEMLDGRLDHLLDRGPVGRRLGRAGAKPREIEEVVDQGSEAVGVVDDRSGQVSSVSSLDGG